MGRKANELFDKFGAIVFGSLLSVVFGLAVYAYGQDLANVKKNQTDDKGELQRISAVQREVVERLARVEVGVDNLNQTSQENKQKLDKNGEKIDDVLQLLVKSKHVSGS